jgi:hypothetical protein
LATGIFQLVMSDFDESFPIQKKTGTVTFRIDANLLSMLRTESEEKQISLNTLVSQILDSYAKWGRFEERVGMILLAKPVVIKLFCNMSKEEIIDLANSVGKDAVKDIALFMGNEIDFDLFLRWLEVRMKKSSSEITHTIKGNIHTYVIKHDLGGNWSLYHKTVLESIFRESFGRTIDIIVSDTILKFSI